MSTPAASETLFPSRLSAALEQAVASVQTVWTDTSGGSYIGDFSQATITGYTVGAKEWEHLIRVCREVGASDV